MEPGAAAAPGALTIEPVGSRLLCFHEPTGRLALLDGLGAALWERLLDGADEASLADHVTGRYDVDPERALGAGATSPSGSGGVGEGVSTTVRPWFMAVCAIVASSASIVAAGAPIVASWSTP